MTGLNIFVTFIAIKKKFKTKRIPFDLNILKCDVDKD